MIWPFFKNDLKVNLPLVQLLSAGMYVKKHMIPFQLKPCLVLRRTILQKHFFKINIKSKLFQTVCTTHQLIFNRIECFVICQFFPLIKFGSRVFLCFFQRIVSIVNDPCNDILKLRFVHPIHLYFQFFHLLCKHQQIPIYYITLPSLFNAFNPLFLLPAQHQPLFSSHTGTPMPPMRPTLFGCPLPPSFPQSIDFSSFIYHNEAKSLRPFQSRRFSISIIRQERYS